MEYFNDDISQNHILEFNGMKGPLLLNQTDVYMFKYIGNRRISIFTHDKKYVVRGGITEITHLVDPERFISPFRGFLVNMQYVNRLNNGILYMKNGIEVPVAQKKLKEIQRFIRGLNNKAK